MLQLLLKTAIIGTVLVIAAWLFGLILTALEQQPVSYIVRTIRYWLFFTLIYGMTFICLLLEFIFQTLKIVK